ncbi:MAG: DNA polymerase III subunit epsilon [Gammaproteobacteria bacterium]|nr:MAG: DNA polymerase III subunit epsilon [Gammaproteobacteria bacterium]
MRQIILDTETTGLEPKQGHRIIEIGCVEMINRKLTGNNYHQYINPQRKIDAGAIEVHGIKNEDLLDKPLFIDIVDDFLHYIKGAELVIHNAPFDVGFINNELVLAEKETSSCYERLADFCTILDTLVMAKALHPGQKNNLNALCRRYGIDNSHRELHGALLDAEILSDVYLLMTGGQTSLSLSNDIGTGNATVDTTIRRLKGDREPLTIVRASVGEIQRHNKRLDTIAESAELVWPRTRPS